MKVTELKKGIKDLVLLYIKNNNNEIKGISIQVDIAIQETATINPLITRTDVEVTAIT